jgi:hypothetical protein
VALNPGLPADAYAQAIEQLAQDRSKQIAVNANRDFYRLLKDGVKVKVPDEHGGHSTETLRVIDWATPANNEFFLASQMWVAGDMYRRRCDLLGFVNGLPLVFIELKKPAVPLKSAFDDNLRDYRGQSVPQLFHPNAFILLSNGSDTKVGTLTSGWEHFFDWKRVADEDEVGKVSLERALRGLLEPARLLDYIENFTVFEEGKGGLIKKTAKNHQFLGVNKSIARLVELRETEKDGAQAPGGVLAHAGLGQEPVDGVLHAEGAAPGAGQLHLRDRDRPRGAGRPDQQDLQGHRRHRARGRARHQRRAPEGAAARQRALHLHADPEVQERARAAVPDAVGPLGRDRHHRRGAPQPVRHLRAEHAQRAAQRRLHRLHRHAADQGRGRAHARGVRRLRQRVRLRPLDRGRRHGAAVLREPHPRGAAHQPGAEPRPGGRCWKRPSWTRRRRRSWSASSAASTTSSPAKTGWRPSPRTWWRTSPAAATAARR